MDEIWDWEPEQSTLDKLSYTVKETHSLMQGGTKRSKLLAEQVSAALILWLQVIASQFRSLNISFEPIFPYITKDEY